MKGRPAAELVEFCSKFRSDVSLMTDAGEEINAKSIISVLSGGVYQGAKVLLQVEGSDEVIAGSMVSDFLENLPD